MDCRDIIFFPQKSKERIEKAKEVFDPKVLSRILGFSLYMFGSKRGDVAQLMGMPEESLKTTTRVVLRDGLQAFVDRRRADMGMISIPKILKTESSVRREGDWVIVDFPSNIGELKIPAAHKVQVRAVLLSLLNSGLIAVQETASVLGVSTSHCRELANKLGSDDVWESLIDKRQGQTQDYLVGLAQKAEIIQQFTARTVIGLSTASEVLTAKVNEQTEVNLSPRTVRWHVRNLGLKSIQKTLPELVAELKKKSEVAF